MAKYDVEYSCGHGTHVVQLFGGTIQRESRIEWMEKNTACPDCYRKRHEDGKPRVFLSKSIYNNSNVAMVFVGNTYPIKDMLKDRGYKFSTSIIDPKDALGLKPLKGWIRILMTKEQYDKKDMQAFGIILDEIEYVKHTHCVDVEKLDKLEAEISDLRH